MAQPTRAHIYCRVSSAGQEDGYSLDTQEAACRRWCSEHGLAVASVAHEVWSGADRHRPELDALLTRILPGDVVLAFALDRLSRSQIDVAILIDHIESSGATLQLVTEDFERSATGTFLRNAKAFVAELEREKIAERTGRGKRARVASGKPLVGYKAAFGYCWADDQKARLVLDPETATIVRSIFDAALDGGTLRGIAASLTARGIPTPMGASRWTAAGVCSVLRRPTYTGVHVVNRTRMERDHGGSYHRRLTAPQDQIALPGIAPAIITAEEFAAVGARLDHNKAHATRHNTAPEATLLRTGYIRCGHCGRVMNVANPPQSRPNSSPKYLCFSPECHARGGTQLRIDASVIDPVVWKAVRSVLADPGIIAREVAQRRQDGVLDRDRDAVAKLIATVTDKQARMAKRIADIDDDDVAAPLIAELQSLAKRRKAAEAERDDLQRRIADRDAETARVASLADWCQTVAANLDTLTYAEKRLALDALGVSVRVHRPGAIDMDRATLARWEITMRPVAAQCPIVYDSMAEGGAVLVCAGVGVSGCRGVGVSG